MRINSSGCLDRCELGPTMVIYPEGVWYHVETREDVDEILQKVQERVKSSKQGEWIVGAGGWGQALPTRQQLDTIAPANTALQATGECTSSATAGPIV